MGKSVKNEKQKCSCKSGTSKTLTRVCFVVSYIIPVDRDLDVKKIEKITAKSMFHVHQSKQAGWAKSISLSCINWLPSFKPEYIYIFVFVMGFSNLSVVLNYYYFLAEIIISLAYFFLLNSRTTTNFIRNKLIKKFFDKIKKLPRSEASFLFSR